MSIELFRTPVVELKDKDGTVALKDLEKVRNIEKYLSGAVAVMGETFTKGGAAKRADAYARAADMSEFKKDADHTLQMMGKVEKTLGKAAEKYDVGTKVAYALGGAERARAYVLGAAAAVAGVMGAHGAEPMMAASLILGAGAFCTYIDSYTPAGKAEDKIELHEYTQIKHAQIALKKMKKALTGEPSYMERVGKLFADGYGNPGGMVTVPYSKEAPAPQSENKTEGKTSYWDQVKKLIAEGYGNPGGMVTVPYSKDETKREAVTPESKKAPKKSSYKEEVAELYAKFGGPSGGFVHNALANKKRDR